eukprot:CAMPEP_0116042498 /NCGR_PEP_ID=MMETSP0321-20121206/25731_1 /TAXON_ID=163516 /ORGANISM="Leptocylindrus danicus var. danicus, Strain B650" /LENGTH=90 /DNA_ID=CAMNT_0003522997 /DNA_START=278 /DNA_END=547 /DNA_ORIENTATION=-
MDAAAWEANLRKPYEFCCPTSLFSTANAGSSLAVILVSLVLSPSRIASSSPFSAITRIYSKYVENSSVVNSGVFLLMLKNSDDESCASTS